jgi:hypothetical protein
MEDHQEVEGRGNKRRKRYEAVKEDTIKEGNHSLRLV